MPKEIVREVVEVENRPTMNPVAGVIYVITGILEAVLALRFLFRLLGANSANGFVSFVYDFTHPLVSPFYGIFSYVPDLAIGVWEWSTLIAMLVWGLLGYGLAALLASVSRR